MAQIIIVDIDGTIADISHRKHFLESTPKDWDAFYKACIGDKPITTILDMVWHLSYEYEIVFCSGRREDCRQDTIAWLGKYIDLQNYTLLLRPNRDFRPDHIVKPELVRKQGIDFRSIAFVLEDRKSVVEAWRKLGLICLQCAEGDF